MCDITINLNLIHTIKPILNVTWTDKLLARQTNRQTDKINRRGQKGVSVSRVYLRSVCF